MFVRACACRAEARYQKQCRNIFHTWRWDGSSRHLWLEAGGIFIHVIWTVYVQCDIEILKSQLPIKLTILIDNDANFWELLLPPSLTWISALSTWPKSTKKTKRNSRCSATRCVWVCVGVCVLFSDRDILKVLNRCAGAAAARMQRRTSTCNTTTLINLLNLLNDLLNLLN